MRIEQITRTRSALLLVCALAAACDKAPPAPLNATVTEPRAFGYQVGDLVERSVTVHAPAGLVLDEASVPKPGARGNALELRSVERHSSRATFGGHRYELTLHYQVFLSPPETRVLELPGFKLRFQGPPRDQEIRIEAWPQAVSPLTPVEFSPRRGLGELRPDMPAPLIDTTPARRRLVGYAIAGLLLLGWLGHVYIGLPWRARTRRPFALAWRQLRGLSLASSDAQWQEAFRAIHGALNRTAGEVLFASGIDRFVAARPRFKPLAGDLASFFERSRIEHFADETKRGPDRNWLREFCRRCRDAERGAT